jgi:hypothetical protein
MPPPITFDSLNITGGNAVWGTPSHPQPLSIDLVVAATQWFLSETSGPAVALLINHLEVEHAYAIIYNHLQYRAFKVIGTDSLPTNAWIMLGESGGLVSGGA